MYFESKPRYDILDGLRGIGALIVLAFHLFETYNTGDATTQPINHGYLAVDFFFLLSGYVIGYAYDDRWGSKMGLRDFALRRLIRLHPMVIMGGLVGVVLYYFGDADVFTLIPQTAPWVVLGMLVLHALMIPVLPSMDIRAWGGTYPLNEATWSLFLEYVANVLYALVIRHLPRLALMVLVACFACLTVMQCFYIAPPGITLPQETAYTVIGGWGIWGEQLWIGVVRLLYPFFCGLLLARWGRKLHIPGGFWSCALLLIVLLAVPRVGGSNPDNFWMNGLYESVIILLVFPVIVLMGAGSSISGRSESLCRWLGEISYPLYITHYPLIYVQMSWRSHHLDAPLSHHIFVALCIAVLALALAHATLRLYDLPVRDYLRKKLF